MATGSATYDTATGVGEAEALSQRYGELFATAALAYIWGYPLVVMSRTKRLLLARSKGEAALNQFVHGTRLLTHKDREVIRPNNDTLYSSAWLDLRGGPVVLEVPDLADRYYSFQFMDAYTNSWAYIGRRTTGTRAASFVIVGPDFAGEAPDGAQLLRSPTPTVWLLGRTLVLSQQDLPAVAELIRHYRLSAVEPDGVAQEAEGKREREEQEAPLSPHAIAAAGIHYFDELGEAMAADPPPRAEAELIERFAQAGIGPGLRPSAEEDPRRRRCLEQGMLLGEDLVSRARSTGRSVVNGWSYSLDLGAYGTNYLLRAEVARYGLGALHPEEALYAQARTDAAGEPLHGSRRYVLRFGRGTQPPVDAFWSLTLYGPDGFLVDNPLGRYSIGDRTEGLQVGSGGELEIQIQADPPPQGPSNWLPAPRERFELSLRCYQPRSELLEGRYAFPAVEVLA